jgi:tetratricopeptide (TPR) repeat protein
MIGIGAFLVWSVIASFRRTDDAEGLTKKWIGTFFLVGIALAINMALFKTGSMIAGAVVPIFTALFAILVGIIWASSWGEMLASPLTNLFSGGDAYNRATPIYGIAEARRKRGFYEESVAEVNKQLADFPGDLTGTMMLVDLYAKDLKRMEAAQEAVESYLDHGPHPAKNTFLALAHLADAYITHDSNRAQAQRCLERIQTLCEGTEQEMIAAQRLAHLTTEEQLKAKHAAKRVHLQPYERGLGLRSSTRDLRPKEKAPEQIANEYIQQLNEHPLDLETRENLALLYANHYQRLDMAIDQLETMVTFRNQAPRQIVKWLNLMADLHIKLSGSIPDAKACLDRVCQLFPDSPHEAQARKRIHLLGREKKGRHS